MSKKKRDSKEFRPKVIVEVRVCSDVDPDSVIRIINQDVNAKDDVELLGYAFGHAMAKSVRLLDLSELLALAVIAASEQLDMEHLNLCKCAEKELSKQGRE